MRIHSTPSTRSIINRSAKRVLLAIGYFGAWAVVPLVAIWPARDPHPQITTMFLAVQHGDLAAVDKALQGGLDVESRDDIGMTPLMAAARYGQLDVVRKLLAAGARIDASTPVFGTPLMAAVMNRHHAIMRELVKRGANADAVNASGQTALWYARMGSDEDAVRILIAGGAVAEGHCTVLGDAMTVEPGVDIRTPSKTRVIEAAHSAVPASPAESERRPTSAQSAP